MLMTPKEAANFFGCNPETIRRWCRSGKVKVETSSRKNGWLLDTEELGKRHLWCHDDEPDTTYTRLKALRFKNRKTMTEVAADLGLGATTYSTYERGKKAIPSKIIVDLALYYDVTTDYLLCMDLYRKEVQNG